MKMMQSEPTLEELEDYNGQESREKKMVIWGVVVLCLIVGGIYTYFRTQSSVEDQLTTKPYILDLNK